MGAEDKTWKNNPILPSEPFLQPVVIIFVNSTYHRIIMQEESLNEELSKLGWIVDISVGNSFDSINRYGKTQLAVGGSNP